jgi:hypothetical protein
MMTLKYITTVLIGLTFVSCNNSAKNVDNNNLSSANTVRQVSDKGTSINYPDNAVYVGQEINDFISLAQQLYVVKKELISLEGANYDIYNVYENGQIMFAVEPDFDKPDIVWRIWVYSTEMKTEKGIGVGSTLAEIKTEYKVKNIGTEEGLNVSVKDISVGFLMDNSKIWWDNIDNEKVFKNIPIETIIIWDKKSYLTLDKKIITN